MSTTEQRDVWLAERNTLIGASETPSILGKGYETAADVWARKVGLDLTQEETERMEIGTVMQPAIVELARRRLQLPFIDEPPNIVRRSETIPYVGASLDAYVRENGVDIPLDAKNVDSFKAREWENEPPVGLVVQLNQQMLVTGATYGYLFALIGGNRTVWHRVERNERFIAAMLKKLEWFWHLVETRTPPPYEDPRDQARILACLYPQDTGTAIPLDEVAARIVQKREALDVLATETENRIDECNNELKAILGTNSYGALPDGRYVSWRQVKGSTYTVTRKPYRALRFHDKRPKDAPALSYERTDLPEQIEYDNEPAPFETFLENAMEAEAAILGIGAVSVHVSKSGSRYLRLPGGTQVRISDHEAPPKCAEWMDRHGALEVRVDEPDWKTQLERIVGVISVS